MKANKVTKLMSLLLSMILIMSVFAGCSEKTDQEATEGTNTSGESNSDDNETKTSEDQAQEAKEKTEAIADGENKIQFPLEEQVTLTLMVRTRAGVDDYKNNKMTEYIEELTNINLEFDVVNESEAEERLNLALSTGTYPDIIMLPQMSAALQNLYGSQGILLPIDEYIPDNGKKTREVLELYPDIYEYYTAQDGHMYNLPRMYDVTYGKCLEKLWIYEPWLEALDLELPTTTEEFYQVLKAFKEQDPNGNGIADEIPMAGSDKSWASNVRNVLMNAFVYYPANQGGGNYLYVDEGEIVASYFQDGFKDGLKYMNKLVDEGLLSAESFTQDGEGLKRMGENPDDVILGAFPGGYQGIGVDMLGGRAYDYVCVEPLEGPNGVKYTKYSPDSIFQSGLSITDACEYPEVAMALADLLYSEELSIMNFVGIKDADWEYVTDESKLGVNGEPARFEPLKDLNEIEPNSFWSQTGNAVFIAESQYSDKDPKEDVQKILYAETKNKYLPYAPPMEMILKQYIYSEEESAEIVTYATSINDFVNQKTAEFAIGILDIDGEWDSFISELEKMGAREYIEVFQAKYNENN